MGEPLRVSVVALDPVLEAGVSAALRGDPDLVLVPPEEKAQVTVIIVDVLADLALDAVRAVARAPHRPQVVLVAADLAPGEALDAVTAGARGLVRRRDATAACLIRAVLATASGDAIMPPDLLDLLLHRGGVRGVPAGPAAPGLTDRERAVLRLVAAGLDTEEIARQLCYSERTVTSVVHDITHRFRLRNRAHAVAYALRTGLL